MQFTFDFSAKNATACLWVGTNFKKDIQIKKNYIYDNDV